MPDIDGETKSYCDCAKGRQARLNVMCIHIQLVCNNPDDFGDILYDGEEPEAFLIHAENMVLFFSIAVQSGSARHHSHKRTIVVYSKRKENNEWRCQACNDPYQSSLSVLT